MRIFYSSVFVFLAQMLETLNHSTELKLGCINHRRIGDMFILKFLTFFAQFQPSTCEVYVHVVLYSNVIDGTHWKQNVLKIGGT